MSLARHPVVDAKPSLGFPGKVRPPFLPDVPPGDAAAGDIDASLDTDFSEGAIVFRPKAWQTPDVLLGKRQNDGVDGTQRRFWVAPPQEDQPLEFATGDEWTPGEVSHPAPPAPVLAVPAGVAAGAVLLVSPPSMSDPSVAPGVATPVVDGLPDEIPSDGSAIGFVGMGAVASPELLQTPFWQTPTTIGPVAATPAGLPESRNEASSASSTAGSSAARAPDRASSASSRRVQSPRSKSRSGTPQAVRSRSGTPSVVASRTGNNAVAGQPPRSSRVGSASASARETTSSGMSTNSITTSDRRRLPARWQARERIDARSAWQSNRPSRPERAATVDSASTRRARSTPREATVVAAEDFENDAIVRNLECSLGMSKKREASLEAENSSLRAEVSQLRAELRNTMQSLTARCQDLQQSISVLGRRGSCSRVSVQAPSSQAGSGSVGQAGSATIGVQGAEDGCAEALFSPGRHIARIEAENERYRLMVVDRDRQLLELQSELQAHKSKVQNMINTGPVMPPAHGPAVFQSSGLQTGRRHGVVLHRGSHNKQERPGSSDGSGSQLPPALDTAVAAPPATVVRSVVAPGMAQRVDGSLGMTPPPTPSPRVEPRVDSRPLR